MLGREFDSPIPHHFELVRSMDDATFGLPFDVNHRAQVSLQTRFDSLDSKILWSGGEIGNHVSLRS